MNEVIQQLMDHVSIRKFNDKKIAPEDINTILNAAMRGATAGNMMSYSIIKIQSEETLRKLAKSCDDQPFISDASLALLFVVDNYKWHCLFEQRGIPDIFSNYNGPIINDMIIGMQDAMIAAQNAVLAAESLGIGTCYIGDIMEHYEYHKELFCLPQYTMPATLVVMGYYDGKPKLRPRFDTSFVVFDEEYPKIDDNFINDMFYEKEKDTPDFAEKFYKRKMNAYFFIEMRRSLYLYFKQWDKKGDF
ncbi:MAG: nitroreductase family protein [Eubacteriales bacterium]|nr:nitroreductase family protein [Eubacteriales bacterium]MDD4583935.1 nitroreductase family protein [Eubacteriales bacterium]